MSEVAYYKLVVHVACEGYRDKFEFEADDHAELAPTVVEVGGEFFERYGDDDQYVEVRSSIVMSRNLFPVYEDPDARPGAVKMMGPDFASSVIHGQTRRSERDV
jgi:hypothetical protein